MFSPPAVHTLPHSFTPCRLILCLQALARMTVPLEILPWSLLTLNQVPLFCALIVPSTWSWVSVCLCYGYITLRTRNVYFFIQTRCLGQSGCLNIHRIDDLYVQFACIRYITKPQSTATIKTVQCNAKKEMLPFKTGLLNILKYNKILSPNSVIWLAEQSLGTQPFSQFLITLFGVMVI